MEQAFNKREVFKVVKDLNGDKAPCPRKFSMDFFQSYWDIIKDVLKVVFLEFHTQQVC